MLSHVHMVMHATSSKSLLIYSLLHYTRRNESYQEELWKRSIDMVREYLSPEILSTYGPPQPSPAIPAQDGDSDTVPPSPPTPAQDGDSDTVPPSPPTPAQDGDSETAHTAVVSPSEYNYTLYILQS